MQKMGAKPAIVGFKQPQSLPRAATSSLAGLATLAAALKAAPPCGRINICGVLTHLTSVLQRNCSTEKKVSCDNVCNHGPIVSARPIRARNQSFCSRAKLGLLHFFFVSMASATRCEPEQEAFRCLYKWLF